MRASIPGILLIVLWCIRVLDEERKKEQEKERAEQKLELESALKNERRKVADLEQKIDALTTAVQILNTQDEEIAVYKRQAKIYRIVMCIALLIALVSLVLLLFIP